MGHRWLQQNPQAILSTGGDCYQVGEGVQVDAVAYVNDSRLRGGCSWERETCQNNCNFPAGFPIVCRKLSVKAANGNHVIVDHCNHHKCKPVAKLPDQHYVIAGMVR